jgi:hypothetical protein
MYIWLLDQYFHTSQAVDIRTPRSFYSRGQFCHWCGPHDGLLSPISVDLLQILVIIASGEVSVTELPFCSSEKDIKKY